MSAPTVNGDPVTLTNTFSVLVSGVQTNTNPTAVTLTVTEPSGNTFSYTNGSLTNTTTGVWTKSFTVSTNGVWTYEWTGDAPAADLVDGQFTVWADSYTSIDVLTLIEFKTGLDITQTDITADTKAKGWITAISRLLDERCGPIRQRTITAERHRNPGRQFTVARSPVAAVTALTSYSGGAGTAYTNVGVGVGTGYTLEPRTAGTGTYSGLICSGDGAAFGEWVDVTYTAGRYADTDTVDPRFKQAAVLIAKNLFRSESVSVGSVDGFDVPFPTFPAAFAVPNAVRDLLGDDWNGVKNTAHTPVMFG